MVEFGNQCGNGFCNDYLSKSQGKTIYYSKLLTVRVYFKEGLNQIYLNRTYQIPKKSMIGLNYNYRYGFFKLQLSRANLYDYYLTQSKTIFYFTNMIMSIRCLVDTSFYLKDMIIPISYPPYTTYNLTAKLELISMEMNYLNKTVNINGNFLFQMILATL